MTITKRTLNISGMGGGYEDLCQVMLWRGVSWLSEAKPPVEMWEGATEYANIVGIMNTEGADLKALEAAMMHKGDDCTGAMHQAVMGHLRFIHTHSVDEWLKFFEDNNKSDRIYEWTGDLEPKGVASE